MLILAQMPSPLDTPQSLHSTPLLLTPTADMLPGPPQRQQLRHGQHSVSYQKSDRTSRSHPYNASSLPILPQGEQLPRAICFSALLCSHYKIHLY
jgi:hypothetical protein